jgi:hypothetical protein
LEAIFVEVSDGVIDNDFFTRGRLNITLTKETQKWQQLSK